MPLMSIGRLLRMHATADPDRPLISCGGDTVTRAEFDRRTNRLARAYAELGVRQDDLVTIALPNGIEFYEATIAAWKLGATPQPVSAKLPHPELDAIVRLANPSLLVGGPCDAPAGSVQIAEGYRPPEHLSDQELPDCVARYWKAPTSGGSTGRPKLIISRQPAEFDPFTPMATGMTLDQTQLVPGPLYHNAPFSLSMTGLTRGHHLVVMKRFDALAALQLIQQFKVNWLVLVPTMMSRIWRLGDEVRDRFDLSSIEMLWHMAAPCPPWLKEAWIHWLGPERVWELYGGTEAQGVTTIRGDEWLARRGSVGRPLDAFVMKILDENGRSVPVGEIGEIYMMPKSGAGTTYHYVGADPKATSDGLETLGDMGWVDNDGYLYIADRRTDMILSGGANVYPAEVEAAIDEHPEVRSSAVIGLPDEDLGNRVHAIVDAPASLTSAELLTFLKARIALYKVPRSVEFVDTPLRGDDGKIRRTALRQARMAGAGEGSFATAAR